MIISVASGKGGTGKTTLATNMALSLGPKVQFLDCDVEEPNAHLFIHPEWEETKTITTPVPQVDETKCNLCGKCSEICQFKAIVVIGDTVLPFHELCHSCGEWFLSDTRFGPMVHARLGIAEENSGKLVTLVRQEAKKLSEQEDLDPIFTKAMVQGKNVFEYNTNSEAGRVVKQIWEKIGEILGISK